MPKQDAAAKAAPSGKKRLLIVEDERPLAHALELKMTREGYDVTVALTGSQGLEQASKGDFSLILLDLIMPELDGFTLLKTIRDKGINTPAIVLSNLGQDEDRAKAAALGVKEYFVKANTPIVDIVAKVKELM